MKKIALFTIAVGEDRIYFDSVARYFPYNKKYFGQGNDVDYYLFTDRDEIIDEITNIPCITTMWPYTTILKNNFICDYLESTNKWAYYDHIFFIDADFAIGDYYDFFSHDFILATPYWGNKKNGGGFFYGGKTDFFKKLCDSYYCELQFIYENKLSLPRDLDEYYLGLFRQKYESHIYLIEMDRETNTLIFYDNEDLGKIIEEQGNRIFIQPYKAEGRANKTMIIDSSYNKQECIVNIKEQYIFNNYTYDFGRLIPIDNVNFQILWAKKPEKREVLNIKANRISNNIIIGKTVYPSPVISIVMPVYNTPIEYLKESIESTLYQTFTDFEFIIIDDGSTDTSCVEFIESYKDQRIQLIKNHHDFVDSLNRGIRESTGRYIVRMDSDDIMMPNRLQIQYDFMEEFPEIDICGSSVYVIGIGRQGRMQSLLKHEQIISSLLKGNTLCHPSIILRKSAVCKDGEDLYKKGYSCAEDYKLWTELSIRGCRFANIQETLIKYRQSENQVTQVKKSEMWRSAAKIQIEYAQNVIEQIIEKEDNFFDFFENLISLFNQKIISVDDLVNIVYQIYLKSNVLINKE